MLSYDVLDGRLELREQIARLMLDGGSTVAANEIVITNGCHGALSIALLSVCKPGDIVAVESPSFHGTMQMLRGFDIKAIEIPTDPETDQHRGVRAGAGAVADQSGDHGPQLQ